MSLSVALCIILGLVTIDQVTKMFLMGKTIEIVKGLLIIDPRYNAGAAFSTLQGERLFFVIFTCIALFFMVYILCFNKWSTHKLFRTALAVMIGGVIGNFIDRIIIGPVRDFIYLPPLNFVCNVADIAITAACVLFVVYLFFYHDKYEKNQKTKKLEEE